MEPVQARLCPAHAPHTSTWSHNAAPTLLDLRYKKHIPGLATAVRKASKHSTLAPMYAWSRSATRCRFLGWKPEPRRLPKVSTWFRIGHRETVLRLAATLGYVCNKGSLGCEVLAHKLTSSSVEPGTARRSRAEPCFPTCSFKNLDILERPTPQGLTSMASIYQLNRGLLPCGLHHVKASGAGED